MMDYFYWKQYKISPMREQEEKYLRLNEGKKRTENDGP
jgi:hypothetical protein